MVLLEFAMSPIGVGESLSQEVAHVLDVVDRSGLPYQVHAMGTLLEGEWDQVMGVVRQCYEVLAEKHRRVSVTLKMDIRQGSAGRLEDKVRSLEAKLGRPLRRTGY